MVYYILCFLLIACEKNYSHAKIDRYVNVIPDVLSSTAKSDKLEKKFS